MNLADRLRGVVHGGHGGGARHADGDGEGDAIPPARRLEALAETLGGEWCENAGRRYLVVDRRYPPGHRLGRVAVADSLPGGEGWPHLHLLAGSERQAPPSGRLLFFDLETTGLTGGAGTYPFLVGCGWFDGAAFRVRQFFLASYAAEGGLLQSLADAVRSADGLVSYNGKSFDVPLIDTRYLFHRMQTPFAGMPHIDMLHPVRRLWRNGHDAGDPPAACRLTTIERARLGHARDGDVAGFEIPARYFHYVRTGDARPLVGVLEHNRQDILALAMVTAQAVQLLADGPAAARTAPEALGLGRLYERGGLLAEARASFLRAVEMPAADDTTRADALRGYALLCRRQRRYADAAAAWRQLLELPACPPRHAHEAAEALAIHHEHRIRDIPSARRFAVKSLTLTPSAARTEAARYRLARLDRKLSRLWPE